MSDPVPNTLPVSCIITSYNSRPTLEKAVRSVLGQTRPIAEIIIADDGSTDGSRDLVARLCDRYANVTSILRQQNVGVAANRDLAIRRATQPFVTHLDGDDLFAPSKIEEEWRALNGDPDAVAYSFIAMIDAENIWRSSILDPGLTAKSSSKITLRNFASRSGPIPRDMLMSKQLYIKAGGMTHGIELYEDWDFKMRLATVARGWRHSGATGTLYIHRPNSLSFSAVEKHVRWKRLVLENVKDRLVAELGRDETDWIFRDMFAPRVVNEKRETMVILRVLANLAHRWRHQVVTHGRFLSRAGEILSLLNKTV
ncbi:glycosyltransferase family 2 protein [Oricola indica]|uniref:glycosyltransferase family 2 protein n=1 Tax=Oricola indica TaxID=2872591 RepID=UPI001CBC5AA8|nr:glycosyltransferase family 2 protein [Oricola indica]